MTKILFSNDIAAGYAVYARFACSLNNASLFELTFDTPSFYFVLFIYFLREGAFRIVFVLASSLILFPFISSVNFISCTDSYAFSDEFIIGANAFSRDNTPTKIPKYYASVESMSSVSSCIKDLIVSIV